jgi:hypothetical protein
MKTIQLTGLSKYLIREDGEIISIWSNLKVLSGGTDKDGYRKFVLIDDFGARRYVRRASLVCTAFNGPRPKNHNVRHLDGTRTNDSAANLAWGTQAENCRDKQLHGTEQRGVKNGNAKITEETARKIINASNLPTNKIVEMLGVPKGIVNNIKYGKAWAWLKNPQSQPNA